MDPIPFDFRGSFASHPHDVMDALRREGSIVRLVSSSGRKEWWAVLGHKLARTILGRDNLFVRNKERRVFRTEIGRRTFLESMIGRDGGEHTRMRDPLRAFFSRNTMEGLRPKTDLLVGDLLSGLPDGEVDLIAQFAFVLPIMVMSSLLGVPAEDRHLFKRWIPEFMAPMNSMSRMPDELWDAHEMAGKAMWEYIERAIVERERSASSQADILGKLMEAEQSGALTREELVANGVLFLIAAFDTTQGTIGGGLLSLFEHPEQTALLRECYRDERFLGNAVEEILRVSSVTQIVTRFPKEEAEFGGVTIAQGETVEIFLASANHDPEVFPWPHHLFLERQNAREHLAFATGSEHFCLGAWLARTELRSAFQGLFREFREIILTRSVSEIPWHPNPLFRIPQQLPVLLRR